MSTEDEEERIESYQKALEADDAEDAAKRKLFDPKKLVEDSRKLKKAFDPEMGEITYGTLNFGDLATINRAESNEEKSILSLHCILVKAYPGLTVDDVRGFGLVKTTRLLKLVVETGPLGQTAKSSKSGLKSASRPKGRVSSRTSTATR